MSPKVSEEPAAIVYKEWDFRNNVFTRNVGRSLPKCTASLSKPFQTSGLWILWDL